MSRLAFIAFAVVTVASRQALADEPVAPPPAAQAADANAAAKPEPKAATPEADSKEAPAEASVFLHVASPKTVRIEREDTGEVVCTSPCDKSVPAGARYRVGGYRPSPSFVLAAPSSGRADVKVSPGNKTTFWTGVGALGLGGALIATGVAVLVHGVNNRAPVGGADSEENGTSYTDAMALGTSLTILGTVAGLWGGATVVSNYTTSVRGDLNTEPKARGGAPARSQQVASGLPQATFIRILGGTF